LVKTILDNSETYATDAPQVFVDELTMLRAGKKESTLYQFHKILDGEWVRIQAARVGPESALVTVTDFDMHVMPSHGKLTINGYVGKPQRGEKPDLRLRLDGARLNTKRPHFDLKL
jgi:hypothetical protein